MLKLKVVKDIDLDEECIKAGALGTVVNNCLSLPEASIKFKDGRGAATDGRMLNFDLHQIMTQHEDFVEIVEEGKTIPNTGTVTVSVDTRMLEEGRFHFLSRGREMAKLRLQCQAPRLVKAEVSFAPDVLKMTWMA